MPKMGEGYLPLLYIPDGAGRYAKLPVLTTTQRDALTAVEGMIIFNSTTDQLEEYDGAVWEAVGQIILDTHIADLDAHTFDWLQTLRTGGYFANPNGVLGTQALTADTLYATPIVIAREVTVDRIAVYVSTGDAGKVARIGIYNDGANLYPGTLKVDGGEIDVGSAALVAATIDETLTKGIYWVAIVSDGTPTVKKFNESYYGNPILGRIAGNFGEFDSSYDVAHTYAALPNPFTAGGTLSPTYPLLIAVRVATLA